MAFGYNYLRINPASDVLRANPTGLLIFGKAPLFSIDQITVAMDGTHLNDEERTEKGNL